MRRLYENIENIYIIGSPAKLTSIIKQMDCSMQNISALTENLSTKLTRYSVTNKGTQYEKLVAEVLSFRDKLYDASMELNEMQKAIVKYQNKIFRYEDMAESEIVPTPFLVNHVNIHVERNIVKVNREEMQMISGLLQGYSRDVWGYVRRLRELKVNANDFWKDSQYIIFAQYIDDICSSIKKVLKLFDNYVSTLTDKLRELN